jgi:hypothetical protein
LTTALLPFFLSPQTLFKNVRTITLFVETNQSDAPQTKIGKIQFFGTPVHTTDMSAIKKC